jgi:hypothetical protein
MSKLLDLLKSAAGEKSLHGAIGRWRQAVSVTTDEIVALLTIITGNGLAPASGITLGANPLNAYTTALLQTGDKVYVQNIQATFVFDASSSAAADQITVVSAVGPGRFFRVPTPSPELQTQTTWFIDPVAGFDENTGLTAGTALKTDAERQRRVQAGEIWPVVADTTITYLNNVPTTDPVIINCGLAANGFLRFKGVATVTYTSPGGGFTAVTNLSRATNVPSSVTEAGLGAGRAGQRIRTTSGASSGAIAWLAKDLGAGAYRTSPWGTMNLTLTPVPFTPTNVNVAPGDQFVVESLTTIGRLQISVAYAVFGGALSVNGVQTTFENLSVTDPAATMAGIPLSSVTYTPLAFGCKWHNPLNGTLCTTNIDVGPVYIIDVGTPAWFGCLISLSRPSVQTTLIADLDTLVQGTGLRVRLGGVLRVGALGSFDSGAEGLLVEDGEARCGPLFGADLLYGATNGTFGSTIRSGGKITYNVKPIITGGTNDSQIGGLATAYAAIPTVTAANNAMFVVFA